MKRSISSGCEFVPYQFPQPGRSGSNTNRVRPSPSDATLQSRLRHLEHLVQILKSQPRVDVEAPEGSPAPIPNEARVEAEIHTSDGIATRLDRSSLEDEGVDDNPGYENILDKIADMTHELRMFSDYAGDAEADDAPIPETRGPMLLLGSFAPASHSEILGGIPPKVLVDHLVRKFFSIPEPAWSKP